MSVVNECSEIRVVVVEDHSLVRWAVRSFLDTQKGIRTVGEADTAEQAVEIASELRPDVVLMDLFLRGGSGLDATREVAKNATGHVLAYSAYDSQDVVECFMEAGAVGFVSKKCKLAELASAVGAAASSDRWISSGGSRRPGEPARSQGTPLSDREREIAALVAEGHSSTEIARILSIGRKTVETHRYRIYKKLQIRTRAELVEYALRESPPTSRTSG